MSTQSTLERSAHSGAAGSSSNTTARDWRPSQRARAAALAAGGGIYALSHVLDLLPAAQQMDSPIKIASHYLFAVGALLIMGGIGSLLTRFRRSPLGVLSVQLVWFGMLFILLSAYTMLYIFPNFGWEGLAKIDAAATVPNILTIPTVVLGPILLAIAGLRHRAMAWWGATLFFVSAAATGLMIAMPEWERPLAIGSTIVLGTAYCVAGLRARSFSAE